MAQRQPFVTAQLPSVELECCSSHAPLRLAAHMPGLSPWEQLQAASRAVDPTEASPAAAAAMQTLLASEPPPPGLIGARLDAALRVRLLHYVYEESKLLLSRHRHLMAFARAMHGAATAAGLPAYRQYYAFECGAELESATVPPSARAVSADVLDVQHWLLDILQTSRLQRSSATVELDVPTVPAVDAALARRVAPLLFTVLSAVVHVVRGQPHEAVQTLAAGGVDHTQLQVLVPGVRVPLGDAIAHVRAQPPLGASATLYELIGRIDLLRLTTLLPPSAPDQQQQQQPQQQQSSPHDGSAAAGADSSGTAHARPGPLLTPGALRFWSDRRMAEATRLLQSDVPVPLRLRAPGTGAALAVPAAAADPTLAAAQQQRLLQLCVRTVAKSVGRGALTLGTAVARLTDALTVPPLALAGRVPPNDAVLALDLSALPAGWSAWPDLHNGAAAGLRYSTDGAHIARTWITSAQPPGARDTHAGVLLGLGLRGLLPALSSMDFVAYLKRRHELTAVAVFLGSAAAHLGTMDLVTHRILCLHVPALVPPASGVVEPLPLRQTAALLGLGLLYLGSAHRRIAEVAAAELRACAGELPDMPNREGYALAAGVTLGLLALGRGGHTPGLASLQLDSLLLRLMDGGPVPADWYELDQDDADDVFDTRAGLPGAGAAGPGAAAGAAGAGGIGGGVGAAAGAVRGVGGHGVGGGAAGGALGAGAHGLGGGAGAGRLGRGPHGSGLGGAASRLPYASGLLSAHHLSSGGGTGRGHSDTLSVPGVINTDAVAAGATLALALLYLRTGNRAIAARLAPPDTAFLLARVRPDVLLLRALARALVLWDDIQPTAEWLASCLPRSDAVRQPQLAAAQAALDPLGVDLDLLALARSHTRAGALLAVGLRFAGTADRAAQSLLADELTAALKALPASGSATGGRRGERLSSDAAQTVACVIGTALGMVMAGTGDVDTMRLLRALCRRVGPDVLYGHHMAASMALGLLFLGHGEYTLSRSPTATAMLLLAFYPRYPGAPGDNSAHLQALRHFYVLAAVPRSMRVCDADSGAPVAVPATVVTQPAAAAAPVTRPVSLPCLLPDPTEVLELRVQSPRYWPVLLRPREYAAHRRALEARLLFVQRRPGYLPYALDPAGERCALSRSRPRVGAAAEGDEYVRAFAADPELLAFHQHFCVEHDSTTAEPGTAAPMARAAAGAAEVMTAAAPAAAAPSLASAARGPQLYASALHHSLTQGESSLLALFAQLAQIPELAAAAEPSPLLPVLCGDLAVLAAWSEHCTAAAAQSAESDSPAPSPLTPASSAVSSVFSSLVPPSHVLAVRAQVRAALEERHCAAQAARTVLSADRGAAAATVAASAWLRLHGVCVSSLSTGAVLAAPASATAADELLALAMRGVPAAAALALARV